MKPKKEDDEEKNKRHFIIHLKKNKQGYLYDKYTYEKEKAPVAVKEKEKDKEESSNAMAVESVEEKKDSLQEIANLASQYQPKGFTLNTSEVKIKQPFLIKGQLREYQLIGLNWMVMLYQRKINGILADEMGLGKTLQTISLLSYLACEKGVWGPHLIVVPTSILVNWEIEFKRWCPALKVMTYFGTPKERKQKRLGWSRINSFHVCITSYKLALQDKKIFRRKKWYYMILDEAHNIKNFKSQRWQTLLNFKSKRRLLLTGTPLQNDVGELWSLMHFLMPNIFHSQADFSEWFLVPMQQSMQKNQSINMNIIQQLHSILRPFLLRRLKKDVEKQLPSKTEVLIRCPLSRRQKYLYDEFINKNETKNKIKNQEFLSLMNVVMQLRKVCNHPDLFEPRAIESGFHTHQGLRFDMPTICLLHHYHKMQNIYSLEGFNLFQYEIDVPSHHLHDIAVNYLPSLEDLFEAQLRNEAEADQYLHHFSYKWKKIKSDFRNENMEVSFHTNTRRVSFQRPLYGITTIHYIQRLAGFGQTEEFLHKYKLIKPLDSVIFDLKGWMDNYMISYDKVIAYPLAYNPSKYSLEYENIQNNLEVTLKKPVQNVTDQFHYAHVRQQLLFPDKKFLIYDCGKLNTMMQLLIQLKMQKHKVLIFTQMTKMLDVFEFSLNVFHMTYVRLDGGTRPDTRQKLVERFNQDPKIFCFISSTRSGGIGINLTGADVVIFYDTDWNPAMDKQAQDRCHRIGQTRNVTIYRLISEYTIEENILLKNMQKRKLDEFIFEEGNFTMDFLEKINMKDILGDMLYTEPTGAENKMSYQQFQKALKSVEDQDDNNAADQATKEQEEVVLEDMKAETAAASTKGLEDENPEIDRSMLPPIFNYGLDFVEGMEDGTFMETEAGVGTEQEGGNEDEMEEEEEQISEEEDLDFMKESEEDSDDEEESFRAMSAKEAMKTYKDTKKLIYQNYFVNV